MRWEDLSMRERAHLMHLYVKGGVMQLSQMKKHYNAFGGPLRDEYDNPEQYYDYNTAEEAGGMYDEKSKHWASRDPRTGMILKNPKHPTFALAIREDQSSGYAPFIDSSTGRYFTLRPEEYATAPNKATLRRASTEELEAIYKESNLDSWNKRADFSKIVPGYTREEIAQRKNPYRDTVWEAAKENNINPEIIDALATLESRYDNNATSSAKAKGIMQLMPVNTKDINPRDGHQNIRRGAEVLAYFLKQNKGDMKKAIAAYNGYTKNPKAKVEKEESKGYSDNYYRGLFPLVDSLQKDSTVGYPFADGGDLGGAHGEVPFTSDYSQVPVRDTRKIITLDNLHELAKDNPKMYREYMQKLPREYQSKVIENGVRSRYGWEGLNGAMYAVAGGLPGVAADVTGRLGAKVGSLASDAMNLSEESKIRKGLEIGLGVAGGLYGGYKTGAQDIGSWLKSDKKTSYIHRPSFPRKAKPYRIHSTPIEKEANNLIGHDFPLAFVDEARRKRVLTGAYDRVAASHGLTAPSGKEILLEVNDFRNLPGSPMSYQNRVIYIPNDRLSLSAEGIAAPKQLYQAYTHEAGHGMTDIVGLDFSMQPKDWPTFIDESKLAPTTFEYFKGNPEIGLREDWDEVIQRVAQVKDAAGITDGKELLSGDQLKKLFRDYTSDPTNSQNAVSDLEKSVTNWDEFAKWSNKFVPAIGLGAIPAASKKKSKK